MSQQMRWEYEFIEIPPADSRQFEELQRHGDAGWEAVGITMRGSIIVVLLKRPLAAR